MNKVGVEVRFGVGVLVRLRVWAWVMNKYDLNNLFLFGYENDTT